ncbi:HD domain-containing protein [Filimonas effusa]|uniref:HD-CE domain-containing protein n=1 Tax=Filimonas effusa TaxID=2508721 RepID=A0A4Q1D0U4_9BACT|nr:ATP-binding protein [Filimonas effusa]RXK81302.1 hypothetical protein ESB13_20410 [Filimonas effusa]
MDKLLAKLANSPKLLGSIHECEVQATEVLKHYITNFPEFTDHSIDHSKSVLRYVEFVLGENLNQLNVDEAYILIMAGFLHDIGMSPTNRMKEQILAGEKFKKYGKSFEEYLREFHHEISYEYISTHWENLKIVNPIYAEAIALVGMGHRVVNLFDFANYNPEFPVKSGNEYVCLPYLAGVLRLADELDITNDRTPDLLYGGYFPTNKISQKEWDKHKANYFVNFGQNTIKITSACYNKDLYFALLKQYGKIEDVIKYLQKLILAIPFRDRSLKVDFYRLEKDVKVHGFIPKEIGFTFDIQNTIDTFVGRNIYNSSFVAIRECLQNAIDSCRFKANKETINYQPLIKVVLQDGTLTISDNGLGMDDFIVEHYFAKLAKSYYREERVSNKYEAIGQFGIGVFSYFMLCNYFDVESKQEDKQTIKFRVTKDAGSYFHFYDSANRNSSGTDITFHLTDNLDYEFLIEKVREYIRYVEIPIHLMYKDDLSVVEKKEMNISIPKMLSHVDRYHSGELAALHAVEFAYSDSEVDGKVAILFQKDGDGVFLPFDNYEVLKTYQSSKVEVSQKGIFVKNFDNRAMDNCIGVLNLLKKNDIKLGRSGFNDHDFLFRILERFYVPILNMVFDNWKLLDAKRKWELSRELMGHVFTDSPVRPYIREFYDRLYYRVYRNEQYEYLTISEVLALGEFALVKSNSGFDRPRQNIIVELDPIARNLKLPLVFDRWAPPMKLLYNLCQFERFDITVRSTSRHLFFCVNSNQNVEEYKIIDSNRMECFAFDAPYVCGFTNISIERPFNTEHRILKYYFHNLNLIKSNPKINRLYDKLFYEIGQFIFSTHAYPGEKDPKQEIQYLQNLLQKINDSSGTDFSLKKSDFPIWIQSNFD